MENSFSGSRMNEDSQNYPTEPILISKILITGPLTPLMPYIVLKELALERGIIVSLNRMKDPLYYAKIFKKIAKIRPCIIENLNNSDDFEQAVNYINPQSEWDVYNLKRALMFINVFINAYREEKIYHMYTFTPIGLQTPYTTYSYNACILYAICRHKNIPLDIDITYEDLREKILASSSNGNVEVSIQLNYHNMNLDQKYPLPIYYVHKNPLDYSDEDTENNFHPKNYQHRYFITKEHLSNISDDSSGKNTEIDQQINYDPRSEHSLRSETNSESETDSECDKEDLQLDENKSSILSEDEEDTENKLETEDQSYHFFEELQWIKTVSELMNDIDYVRNHFSPLNNAQAIVIGSYVHHQDLSRFKNPLDAFRRTISFDRIDYVSESKSDIYMRNIEKYNPFYTDLNLYFNPYLPKTLYKKNLIDHHINLFSYSIYDYINLESYEILQELYLEDHFHLGWHPNIMNKETPIELDLVDDLPNEMIVCYGVREESLYATTWKELYELFKNTNLYLNPFEKNSILSSHKIGRLVRLGNLILSPSYEFSYLFNDYQDETKDVVKRCVDIIESISLFQKSEFEMFKEHSIRYQNLSYEEKEDIIITLDKLLETTMYMRGWSGKNEYPVLCDHTGDNDMIEKRTVDSLIVLDEWNERTNNYIYSMPLIMWKNDFIKVMSDDQGLTIGDRVNIVKSGETENINSCIRMTSNVFGASYCFYCKLFKIPEKFNIKDLIYIQ